EEGILLEFFREYGEEMIAMEWYEVTQEMIWEIQREEALADAREEGLRQGIEQGIERGIEQGIEQGIERGIEQGIEQGIAQGRAESEKTILMLKEQIKKLERQLATFY
ncbi:MAG: hypothetical protein IJ336_04090, partial [Lachnospiraceae bacterium]|nr:hypothetical protein [Lachnospiraceae bacterium]